MSEDKRLFKTQANAIKCYIDKVSPISSKRIAQIAAMLGFRWLPKFFNNRISTEQDKFTFSDWTGIWVTSASGLLTLSYFGGSGFRYWLFAEGVGNGVATVFYNL